MWYKRNADIICFAPMALVADYTERLAFAGFSCTTRSSPPKKGIHECTDIRLEPDEPSGLVRVACVHISAVTTLTSDCAGLVQMRIAGDSIRYSVARVLLFSGARLLATKHPIVCREMVKCKLDEALAVFLENQGFAIGLDGCEPCAKEFQSNYAELHYDIYMRKEPLLRRAWVGALEGHGAYCAFWDLPIAEKKHVVDSPNPPSAEPLAIFIA